jgi:hypothetical protein
MLPHLQRPMGIDAIPQSDAPATLWTMPAPRPYDNA